LVRRRGEQYPPYQVLSDALKVNGLIGASAKAVLRMIQKLRSRREPVTAPGLFCSQLVATYFQIMGLSLWVNGEAVPGEVNPNDLARPATETTRRRHDKGAPPISKLVPVFGAVARPQPRQWLRDYRSFKVADLQHRRESGEELDDHEGYFLSGQILREYAKDWDANAALHRRAGVQAPDVSAARLAAEFENCPLKGNSG
jgi:hypothetical protein